jgi:hypothetical protein
MEEYTLVNWFTERFRTGGRQSVRLKEGQFLENFVLKKKRECERDEEEGDPWKVIGRRAPSMMTPYKQSRTTVSISPYNTPWRPRSTCPWRAPIMVAPCSSPRAPPRLAPLPGSSYGQRFPEGLFVNFFRRVKLKNYTHKKWFMHDSLHQGMLG